MPGMPLCFVGIPVIVLLLLILPCLDESILDAKDTCLSLPRFAGSSCILTGTQRAVIRAVLCARTNRVRVLPGPSHHRYAFQGQTKSMSTTSEDW